jgi:hypothetical protein
MKTNPQKKYISTQKEYYSTLKKHISTPPKNLLLNKKYISTQKEYYSTLKKPISTPPKTYYSTPTSLAKWARDQREGRARRLLIGKCKSTLTRINKTISTIKVSLDTQSTSLSKAPLPKDPTPAEIINSLLRFGSDGKCTNAFETLCSIQVLKLAYETIKSKSGNMVKGVTPETLDGISVE